MQLSLTDRGKLASMFDARVPALFSPEFKGHAIKNDPTGLSVTKFRCFKARG